MNPARNHARKAKPMDNTTSPQDFRQRREQTKKASNPTEEFTGPNAALQVRIPRDLIVSLKLHSLQNDRTISDIVLECLTTDTAVTKAWVQTRRAA